MANVDATVISFTGSATLVQWTDEQGEPQRGYIPTVEGQQAGASLPVATETAIPYAEPLFVDEIRIPATRINTEMKRHGLWTTNDVRKRPNEALGVLMGVARMTLYDIYQK